MALQSALLDVPFATGLQQKQDSRLLAIGAATTLTNGVVDKAGAISKRPGSTNVTNTSSSVWGNQVFTFGSGQTVGRQRLYKSVGGGTGLLSGHRAWTYSPTKLAWSDIDNYSPLTANVTGIASPVVACTSYDVAYGSGYAAIVYAYGLDCFFVLQDQATGAIVYGPFWVEQPNSTQVNHARVLIQGGYAIVVYQDAGTLANLRAVAFDLTAWTWGADTLLVNNHENVAGRFDIHAMGGSTTKWVLVYDMAPGAQANLNVALFTAPLVAGATATFNPPAGWGIGTTIYGCTVHATSGEQIWLGYSTLDNALVNNSQRAIGLNPTTLAVTTADFQVWTQVGNQVVKLGIERLTATSFIMSGALLSADLQARIGSTAGVGGVQRTVFGWHPASKPFTVDGKVCVLAVCNELPTGTRPTYAVVHLNPSDTVATHFLQPLATISPRIVSTGIPAMQLLPSSPQVSSVKTLTVGSSIRSGADNIGVDLISIDSPPNNHQIATLGGVNYVACGLPSVLTSQRVTEIGFMNPPAQIVGTPATTAGAMTGGQTYNYLVVYEWIDEVTGQRVQSAYTPAQVVLAAANNQVTLTGTCLHLTAKGDYEKPSIVGIAVYRTAPTISTGVYYRLFSGVFPATLQNNQANAQFSYIDLIADTTIIANEAYNTAQLQPANPPSFVALVAHGNRLVGANGTDVWFSKLADGGTSQPQFSDALVVSVQDGGPITALASMDGQLIIFKRDAIYVIQGDGPDNNGGGNSWSDPRRVASDVGCTSDWRSVLAMPMGVIFQSEKKLMILTRGLEAQYFSQPVEDELAAMPVVQCITLHSRRDEVRVCLRAAEGGSGATTGATLNWNYVSNVWSKFDYYDTGNNHQNAMWESAAAIDGVFWYASTAITQTENVNLTATGAYLDGNSWVTLSLETAWAKASGISGWGRFWRAFASGARQSPHDLTIAIATDYEVSYNQTNTFTALTQSTWGTYLEEANIHIGRQKASAIRVRLSDAAPTGVASTTGAGPTFLGIQLEVGLYKGGKRLPDVQGA